MLQNYGTDKLTGFKRFDIIAMHITPMSCRSDLL